ncbi:DMT family transporter [Myroides sp. LJL119]
MKIKPKHWITLIFLSLIWGSSFILIKKGLEHFSPLQVGALRICLAGVFLLPISLKNIKKLPKRNFPWLFLTAITGSFIPMFLFPIAETHLHSSIAGILNALMSIFVIVLGAIFFKYKTHTGQFLGVVLSFIGVILLLQTSQGSSQDFGSNWIYYLLLILATLMYAYSGLLTQKYMGDIPAIIWTAFIELILLIPGLIVLISTGFFQIIWEHPSALQGIGYIVLLAFFGSALANIYYYKLIQQTNATFASSVSLLMPLVAYIWGILHGETLSDIQIIGAALIIAGLYFGEKKISFSKIKQNYF